VSWTPWSRLNLQAGFNYVLSDTATPASDVTQAILDAQNNYWSVNFTSSLVLDDKTDLNVSYFYYQADDYYNNSLEGVPYGAGAQEHCITATLTRRISDRIRLSLKYGYFRCLDAAAGGNADFGANLVYATFRYRF
jgi:peptidoglycan hydrolase-like protein with peptidoglycan-binding domain